VVVNGEELYFPDEKPFHRCEWKDADTSKVYWRSFGSTVTWDGNAKKAVFKMSGTTLELLIGKREYQLNGQKKQMDTKRY